MSKSFYHKISDEQWKIIEPHLPKPKSTGLPGINPPTAFNSIFWMLDSLVENSRKYFLVEIDSTFCKVHQWIIVKKVDTKLRNFFKVSRFKIIWRQKINS